MFLRQFLFSVRPSKWSPYWKHSYQNPVDKDEGVPVHAMKACRRSRSIAPLILHLGTKWLCAVKLSSNNCAAAVVRGVIVSPLLAGQTPGLPLFENETQKQICCSQLILNVQETIKLFSLFPEAHNRTVGLTYWNVMGWRLKIRQIWGSHSGNADFFFCGGGWDATPCLQVSCYRRWEGSYWLHL